ncbi:cobW-domain-containing protein [Mycena floridula]|nr:cobW-domain-containing protein [Mycena floridula]
MSTSPIPITVVTGFLGSGKTTLILSLLKQLPTEYKVVVLKNEFGDVEVDSLLLAQSSLAAVSEILNGCLCCVAVGKMSDAVLEIRDKYNPDRIIIECSGSAFPATLAFQLRELERSTIADTNRSVKLDATMTVIDAENFVGYEDTSPTAKMQAQYTDLLVITKHESLSPDRLDTVLDHLHTLNDLTPKVKAKGRNGIAADLIFGINSTLLGEAGHEDHTHNHEVETVTIQGESPLSLAALETALAALPSEIWRVKGFVRTDEGIRLVNWAWGRGEILPWSDEDKSKPAVRLTAMGEHGQVKWSIKRFVTSLEATLL